VVNGYLLNFYQIIGDNKKWRCIKGNYKAYCTINKFLEIQSETEHNHLSNTNEIEKRVLLKNIQNKYINSEINLYTL
jgi:hypothetical protein